MASGLLLITMLFHMRQGLFLTWERHTLSFQVSDRRVLSGPGRCVLLPHLWQEAAWSRWLVWDPPSFCPPLQLCQALIMLGMGSAEGVSAFPPPAGEH